MPTEFEISKITEIVAGKMGARLDAKALRRVVDAVVDKMKEAPANPEITGVTCDVPRSTSTSAPTAGPQRTYSPQGQRSQPLPPDEAVVPSQGGLYDKIERTDATRIIIAAFGRNRPGVVAAVTNVLAEMSCNIEDISQTIMQEFFSMIMIVDIKACSLEFAALRDRIKSTEQTLGMQVFVMHEDTFRYMHRI